MGDSLRKVTLRRPYIGIAGNEKSLRATEPARTSSLTPHETNMVAANEKDYYMDQGVEEKVLGPSQLLQHGTRYEIRVIQLGRADRLTTTMTEAEKARWIWWQAD